jgi:nitrogen PTS system EIIA component
MEIKDILAPDGVLGDIRAPDKGRLLQELSQRAAVSLGIEAGAVANAILKREDLGSTGVGAGVALPHARLPHVVRPFGILARLRKPIDFAAIDAEPVDLVFLLLLSAVPEGEQLNALACVARKLRIPEVAAALRGAGDAAQMYRAMAGG